MCSVNGSNTHTLDKKKSALFFKDRDVKKKTMIIKQVCVCGEEGGLCVHVCVCVGQGGRE